MTTEYEKERLENIAKNRMKLKELELDFERSLAPTAPNSLPTERPLDTTKRYKDA
jgi:hypothetical protein